MQLHWIRLKLYQWGRLNRAQAIGYPTMATTEKARVGRGGSFSEPTLPPDLEEIDTVIRTSRPQHKLILVEHYTKDGTAQEHAAHLSLAVGTYYRRKKLAESHVYSILISAAETPTLRARQIASNA